MEDKPQTYANHKRVNPLFHLFVSPILIANVAIQLVAAFEEPSFDSIWATVVAIALYGLAFSARHMALILQNRLISHEEKLRLARVLPEDLRARIPDLRLGQLIALRFASDAEIPALVQETLAKQLSTKDIKKLIKNWKADEYRV